MPNFLNINIEDVVSVYNGKDGCCCGCNGTHSESNRSKTLAVNKINAVIDLYNKADESVALDENKKKQDMSKVKFLLSFDRTYFCLHNLESDRLTIVYFD